MIKALLIRRLVAVAFTVATTAVIPYLVHDKPRIKWVWEKAGPVIVDAAEHQLEQRLEQLD